MRRSTLDVGFIFWTKRCAFRVPARDLTRSAISKDYIPKLVKLAFQCLKSTEISVENNAHPRGVTNLLNAQNDIWGTSPDPRLTYRYRNRTALRSLKWQRHLRHISWPASHVPVHKSHSAKVIKMTTTSKAHLLTRVDTARHTFLFRWKTQIVKYTTRWGAVWCWA